MFYILQHLSMIYDMEIALRFFINGESWRLDGNRLKELFPTRLAIVGGRRTTRQDEVTGAVITLLDRLGQFSKLSPKAISGNVPHSVLRYVKKDVFENLVVDIGSCSPAEVCANLVYIFLSILFFV